MPQPTKSNGKPRLVNRGGAGLYGKLTDNQKKGIIPTSEPADAPKHTTPKAKYQIAPAIANLAVPINSVTYDPDNARLHPERNVEAIKESLTIYGQVKPIVVQKSTMHVVAGNGTLKCARELGWKKIAAAIVDMTDSEAAGYGLADNKTAELAKWDFETDVLKRIDAKMRSAGIPMTGWSESDLAVLRMADWVPPPQTDEVFGLHDAKFTIRCNGKQYAQVDEALNELHNRLVSERKVKGDKELPDIEYLLIICKEWMEYENSRRQENEIYKDLNNPSNFV